MRPTISGSSIRRVMKCPPSSRLPQVNRESDAMARGTFGHLYLERLGNKERDPLRGIPEDMHGMLMELNPEALGTFTEGMNHEVAYAYDMSTKKARRLQETAGHRDYSECLATEIPCTLDVVSMRGYVADYKFGWGIDELSPPAAVNEQLAFGALCVARAHGILEVDVEIIKILPDGGILHDRAHLDVFALDEFERRLQAMWRDRETESYAAGAHCDWCPAYNSCPAHIGLITALVQGTDMMGKIEATKAVVERVMLHEKLVKTLKEQLQALSDQVPIPMGDGKVYGPVTERHILGGKAMGVLKTKFSQQLANDAVETKMSASQASIKEALTKHGIKVTMADLMEELELAGAVKQVVKHKVHRA